MKVLFAVKNESLSNAIIEKYRRKYKEILTFKNVYYYNAIIKELQKNKDYDRILISEELEDFANNNNYDTIDKFIFDKLDSISDEANDASGREISIIFICTDRRQKGDELLSKLFSIGVYNALIGDDRTYDAVCSLIKNPRTKKDAKNYYKIDIESSNYRAENENGVSEVEIQNILAHFRRLGKSTEKYAKSFDTIAAQYNEEQLRIIANCLPPKVKSVLAATSEKYKKLASTGFGLGVVGDNNSKNDKKNGGIRVNTLDNTTTKSKITKPIVIPAGVKKVKPKNVENSEETTSGIRIQRKPTSLQEQIERRAIDEKERIAALKKQKELEMQELGETQKIKEKAPEKEKKEKVKVENKPEAEDEDIFADEIFNDDAEVKDKVEKFDEDLFDDVSDKKSEPIKKAPEKVEKEKLSLDDDDDDDFSFNDDFLGDVDDVIESNDEPEFEIGKEDPEDDFEEEYIEPEDVEEPNDLEDDDEIGFDFDDMAEDEIDESNKSKATGKSDYEDDDDEFDFEDAVLETSDELESPSKRENDDDELDLGDDDDIFGTEEDFEDVPIEETETPKANKTPEVEDDDDLDFGDDDDDMFGDSNDFEEESEDEIEEEPAPKANKTPEVEDDDDFEFGDDDDDIFGDSNDFEEESEDEIEEEPAPKVNKTPEVEEDDDFEFGDDDDDIFGASNDFEEESEDEIEEEPEAPKSNKTPEVDDDDEFDFDDDIFGDSNDFEEESEDEIEEEPEAPKANKTPEVEDDDDFEFGDDDDDIFGDSNDFEEESEDEIEEEPEAPKTNKTPEVEDDDEFDFDDDIFGASNDFEDEPVVSKTPKVNKTSEVEENDDLFDDIADIPGLDELDNDNDNTNDTGFEDDDELFDDIADIPDVDDVEENKEIESKTEPSIDIDDIDDIDEDDNMFDDMVDIPGLDDLDDFSDTPTKNVQPEKETKNSSNTNIEKDDFEEFDEDIFGDDDSELPDVNAKKVADINEVEEDELFEDSSSIPGLDDFDDELFEEDVEENENQNSNSKNDVESIKPKVDYSMSNINKLLTKDKKIVNFVGTTKNGTSFLVNNLAKLFSSIGVNTAILDMTKNRNSYYIFTNNDEELRKIAQNSFEKLETGYAEGIRVDKNLTVYTNLPTDDRIYKNAEAMFSTLLQNHTLILVDCDFDTDTSFFALCQELYLVQSLDILTMQPLTTFLRGLQVKEILEPEKLRVVINKDIKVRDLTPKAIIGGMSYYKDPGMSVMVELFNKDMVQACSVPFEDNTYSKYLEAIANCDISLSGYSKAFMAKLKNLGEMIYSLNSKPSYASSPITQDYNYNSRNKFSNNMNNTLKEMKKKF